MERFKKVLNPLIRVRRFVNRAKHIIGIGETILNPL